ncbi:MAG: aminodeoxychorismate lyase [Pseudomonadota bacterium]
MGSCLIDGEIANHVPADDRGIAYGDGVFETLPVIGGVPVLWQAHMDRLALGGQRLGLATPPQEVLLRELKTVAAGMPRCVVKVIVSRGSGGRGYAPPADAEPRRIVSAHDWPEELERDRQEGVEAMMCETRLALQPRLRGIKHLNRLEQVLGAAELATVPGVQGIQCNTEGFVISGVHANLFIVVGGQCLTPRMDRSGVHGVLRGLLLREHGARAERRRITQEFLLEADEVFFCSTLRGIVPLRRLGERHWDIGPVTREMQAWHASVLSRP